MWILCQMYKNELGFYFNNRKQKLQHCSRRKLWNPNSERWKHWDSQRDHSPTSFPRFFRGTRLIALLRGSVIVKPRLNTLAGYIIKHGSYIPANYIIAQRNNDSMLNYYNIYSTYEWFQYYTVLCFELITFSRSFSKKVVNYRHSDTVPPPAN